MLGSGRRRLGAGPRPCGEESDEKEDVDVGEREPHGGHAAGELVEEHHAGVREFETNAIEHAVPLPNGILGDPGKHDPKENKDEGGKLNVSRVIRHRHTSALEEGVGSEEECETKKEVVESGGPEDSFDPGERFHSTRHGAGNAPRWRASMSRLDGSLLDDARRPIAMSCLTG